MKKYIIPSVALVIGALAFWYTGQIEGPKPSTQKNEASPIGRAAYELARLADPQTGKIPANIHMRELAYASNLPRYSGQRDSLTMNFSHLGPYNVGGRTRAIAIDVSNPQVYFAGGVSGGMWRSDDEGQSWTRVTAPQDHAAVSCIEQDPRPGKTNIWYYGSGETVGNSASKSFSAYYRGNGIYKSTDGGLSWNSLASTTALQQKPSTWDAVFRIAVDPTRNDSDVVLAAIGAGIMRSNDGGNTWTKVLGSSAASFTDLIVTSTGVFYAALSSDAGTAKGFWRSEDGLEWFQITPAGFPANHDRTVMAIPASNENLVFYFSGTPNAGNNDNSLWKYNYVSGNGTDSGGVWTNLSSNIPSEDLSLYNGYCQVLAVKPDNEDVIFIGGTNLFRSTNGFSDSMATIHVGGYRVEGSPWFNYRSGVHYPDQQAIRFHPTDPSRMISTTDGGIHRTENCTETNMQWVSLSNGYVTSQFYGIAIDHGTDGSEEVIGGLQDRGTFWTNSADPQAQWSSLRGADGAYVAITDGGQYYYTSTQYANIRRGRIDGSGNYFDDENIMPPSLPSGEGSGFLFVHPFTLDPANNNIMYLPYQGEVWRNDNLDAAGNGDLSHWELISDVAGTITTIAASEAPQGTLYFGTSSSAIYRVENAHTTSATSAVPISEGIAFGGYTSCIAVDPSDAENIMVVFSNYNVNSLWHSPDGGETWVSVEGNLKGTTDPNVPKELSHIGDGPSIRWAEIIPLDGSYVYFVGTSVGLFSTRELNGDSTVWVQEGAGTIGNVVVDMLDYRALDKWLVVGTHGNGIYAGNLVHIPDSPSGTGHLEQEGAHFTAFPNPAAGNVTIAYNLSKEMHVRLTLFDQQGRTVKTIENTKKPAGPNTVLVNLDDLPSGLYYYNLTGEGINSTKRLVKQ